MVDKRLEKQMFRPSAELRETRMGLAAIEAVKAKRLLGALRSLWRSSATGGLDDKVAHLKTFLAPSPTRVRPSPVKPEPSPEPVESVYESPPFPAGDSGDESKPFSAGGSGDESKAGDEVEGSDSESERQGVEASQTPLDSSGEESLEAPTLCLDPSPKPFKGNDPEPVPSSDSEDSLHRDSQIPGKSWMGKAMMKSRETERLEMERQCHQDRLKPFLLHIKSSLLLQLNDRDDELEGDMFERYQQWCVRALLEHGDHAVDKLATLDLFRRWCWEQKHSMDQDQ